jgi:hypothetical protein
MSERNESLWQALNGRHAILFAETGTPYFTEEAFALGRIRSKSLGERLWANVPGQPWEFLFVVGLVRRIQIPKSELLSELDYSDNYWLPGTIRVSDERCRGASKKWGSIRALVDGLQM